MMLKDCPVGSFVRLVSLCSEPVKLDRWKGTFEVKHSSLGKYVTDGDGSDRYLLYNDTDYQFEIINPSHAQHKTVYLKGKTYNLIPVRTSNFIEIDGVEYYMEERE